MCIEKRLLEFLFIKPFSNVWNVSGGVEIQMNLSESQILFHETSFYN